MNPLDNENVCEMFVSSYGEDIGDFYYGWVFKYQGQMRAYGGPLNVAYPTQEEMSVIYCGLAHGCGWLRSWIPLEDLCVVFKLSDRSIVDCFVMETSHPLIHVATTSIINNVTSSLLDFSWRIVHPTKNVAFRYAKKSAMHSHEMFF